VGRVDQSETRHNYPDHAVERVAEERAPHGGVMCKLQPVFDEGCVLLKLRTSRCYPQLIGWAKRLALSNNRKETIGWNALSDLKSVLP
jgi:hypothetical protein